MNSPSQTRTARPVTSKISRNNTVTRLATSTVSAGFTNIAEDFTETELDLNEHLVKNPAATFFVRVVGTSMIGAGIHPNDLLIVDRSLDPSNGRIVIALLNGEFTVKRLRKRGEKITLQPENSKFRPVPVQPEDDFEVWGVVTTVIHPASL